MTHIPFCSGLQNNFILFIYVCRYLYNIFKGSLYNDDNKEKKTVLFLQKNKNCKALRTIQNFIYAIKNDLFGMKSKPKKMF